MRVLVTRPRPDADRTAAELSARGHAHLVAPLFKVVIDADARIDLAGVQAVLVTSANGARALAAVTDRRDIHVLAVGDASALQLLIFEVRELRRTGCGRRAAN